MTPRRFAFPMTSLRPRMAPPAWWLAGLACLAAFPASPAAAQTVKVRQAPPGATIEVVYNGTRVATTAADDRGAVDVALPAGSGATGDIDANIFVDECGTRRRVVIGIHGTAAAPQEPNCVRREIQGVFLVRPASTLVVNMSAPSPSLLLRQGAFDPDAPPREWAAAPTGLVLSGGGGFTFLGNTGLLACGTAASCNNDTSGLGYAAGVTYWFTRNVAAEVGFLKPGNMKAEGSGGNYRFTSTLETEVITVGGRVGFPVGPLRIYGKAGADYHWATFSTEQTVDAATITVGDVTETIPGGTQTLAFETKGWDWVFGGGLELWLNRHFAAYTEFGRAGIKGDPVEDVEAAIEDRAFYIVVGASVRIGR